MRKLSIVLVSIAMAVVAAGCGSSGGSSKAAPTKAEFLKQANAICKAGAKELAAKEKAANFDSNTSQDKVVAFVKSTTAPSIRKQIADVKALGFPKGDEATLTKVLDDSDAMAAKLGADPAKYMAGADPFADLDKQLTKYGLTACGSDD